MCKWRPLVAQIFPGLRRIMEDVAIPVRASSVPGRMDDLDLNKSSSKTALAHVVQLTRGDVAGASLDACLLYWRCPLGSSVFAFCSVLGVRVKGDTCQRRGPGHALHRAHTPDSVGLLSLYRPLCIHVCIHSCIVVLW